MKKEETKHAPTASQNVEDLIEGAKRHRSLLDSSKGEAPDLAPARPRVTQELKISTFVGEISIPSSRKEMLT